MLDFSCIALVAVFREAFAKENIDISEAEARAPMGVAKREYIKLILAQAEVQERWCLIKLAASTQTDVAISGYGFDECIGSWRPRYVSLRFD